MEVLDIGEKGKLIVAIVGLAVVVVAALVLGAI